MSIAGLLQDHAALAGELPGAEQSWLKSWRADRLEQFKELGLPTPRDEHWRYTDASRMLPEAPVLSLGPQSPLEAPEPIAAKYQAVLHNGHFCPRSSSLPDIPGIEVLDLAGVLANAPERLKPVTEQGPAADGFAALNQAFLGAGVAIFAKPDAVLDAPLEIIHLNDSGCLAQPTIYLDAAPRSRLQTIERWHPNSAGFHNSLRFMRLAQGAQLDYYAAQLAAEDAAQVARLHAELHADSRLHCHTASLGGRWLRNTLRIDLVGRGAHCELLGLACGGGQTYRDNHLSIRHAAPDCTSDQRYKYVLDGTAKGVFHGHIEVARAAQHTAAEQNNRALLLSSAAEMNSKPQLEIYADDVKCAHGAAMGQLDEDALFYLRSRGLPCHQARAQLIFGFINELLEPVPFEPLRRTFQQQLSDWLAEGIGLVQ